MVWVTDRMYVKVWGQEKQKKRDFWSFIIYIICWANVLLSDHLYRKKDTAYLLSLHVRTGSRVKSSEFWSHLLHSFPICKMGS